MFPDIDWSLFITELGLISLAAVCLFLDLFLPAHKDKGKILANTAIS